MPYGFKLPGTDIVKVPNSGGVADPTKLPLAGGTLSGLLNFTDTTHAGIRLNSLTTTQRDALTAGAGDFLFNTTLNQFQGYVSGAWASMAILGANIYTGQQRVSVNGAASTPPLLLNGTVFTGGSATTTKPQFLIEPTGTTSNAWKTTGTMLGVNAPSGFAGDLLSLQKSAAVQVRVDPTGNIQWDALDNTVSIGRQGNGVQFCADGAFTSKLTSTELRLTSAQACVWTDGSAYAGATVTSLRQATGAAVSSPCLQLGADAASSQVSQAFRACGARIGTDTNTTPTNTLTIAGPHNTGTGTGGDLRLGVYGTNGASGTAIGTLNTVLTIVAARKTVNISSIPTSAAGLSSGDVYSNAGILTIV